MELFERPGEPHVIPAANAVGDQPDTADQLNGDCPHDARRFVAATHRRSEEHTSELQSLMRISYAVFCLKKKKKKININRDTILTTLKISKTKFNYIRRMKYTCVDTSRNYIIPP